MQIFSIKEALRVLFRATIREKERELFIYILIINNKRAKERD